MRLSVATVAFCLFIVGFSAANDVHASIRKQTNIPAEGLGPALETLAKDRNFQIVYVSEEISALRTQGAVGELTIEEALKRLLSGTGFTYRFYGDNAVSIVPIGSPTASRWDGSSLDSQAEMHAPTDPASKDSTLEGLRLAQVDQGSSASPSAVTPTPQNSTLSPDASAQLAEVIVTAQKRSERIQDVPVPVTVLSAEALVNNNQLRVQDYYATIPGLSVSPQSEGSFQILSIRGITTGGYQNPTVGVTVDDVPFGASTSIGTGGDGQIVPDIDPADLAQVEVLRGPQGTLYGASSLGGLLKFVTVDPSTDGVTGRIQADVNSVYSGAELGYGARGSVNVPLSDTLAVRASGFTRQDPGYIDNVETGQRGVNEAKADGARLSALWKPSQGLSLKLSALYQQIKGDGEPDVDLPVNGYVGPVLGDLQQYHLRGSGDYDREIQAYSAVLTAKLGRADLTVVSGYNVSAISDSYDVSSIYLSLANRFFGVSGTFAPENNRTDKFTQEVRLSIPIGQRLEWLVGGFYTYENSKYDQADFAESPSSGPVVGELLSLSLPSTYTEYAGFTDLTAHVTDQFEIQIGARESQIKQTLSQSFAGPVVPVFYGAPSPVIGAEEDTKANAFTYLVTPQFRLSPDLMVYARLASGYRAGGINYEAGIGTPAQYKPDTTKNYELGLKGDFLEHKLSLDASIYYIDWKNIQLGVINPTNGVEYIANASPAKSQGLELSAESRPLTGLKIDAWVAWDDAELTRAFPSTSTIYGVSGDPLPYTSRFSANSSLQQDFLITNRVTGFVGCTLSYVGDRQGEFTSTAQRQNLPAYAKTDLHGGAKYDSWTVNLFVNNIADKRGVLYGGLGAYPPWGFNYIQPRTVGLSVVKTF